MKTIRQYVASVLWQRFAIALLLGGAQSNVVGAVASPSLRADYQFQNTLNSSVAGAPALVDLGPNTFGPAVVDGFPVTVLSFAQNDGLFFPAPGFVPSGNYSVVMLFEFSETIPWPWERIIDFENRTSDYGLYGYNGGMLNFYNVAVGSDAFITAGAWVQVVVTRDVFQNVAGYVNGVQQFSFVDTNGLAVMDGTAPLRFFQDDLAFPNEAAPGFVARIRLYDGALTPTTVATLDRLPSATNAPRADLQVSKIASPNTVSLGQPVVFTVTVQDLGPGNITNAVVTTDCLPAGFQFVTDSTYGNTNNGTYSPGTCWWTLPNGLNAGQIYTLQITALANSAGLFTNIASVAVPPGVTDTNLANNIASAVVTVTPPQADLRVTKTASTNTIRLGQSVVFTVTVQNLGPGSISNAIVTTDCLPAGFQYVTDSTYGNATNGTYSPGTCWWTLPNGLNPGQTFTLQITALANTVGVFTNVASVAVPPGITDPNLANNAASAVVTVTALRADLAVTKTVDAAVLPVNSPAPFHFYLTVTNLGPDTVSNLTLIDLLPAGLAYSSVNTLAYEPSNGLWSVPGPLSAGQGTAIILGARGTNGGTFTNTLTVTVPAGVMDTNLINNSASAVVTVLPVYSVSGYVDNCRSNGTPLANLTVTLSGAANQAVTTIPGGLYRFSNLSNGVYTITPSQPGNRFVPVSQTITVSNGDVTLPTFVGSVGLIYGGVFYFGSPVTNHPIRLTGAQSRTILTDRNGYYIFTNTPPGNYTVTPAATNGYSFSPTNATFALNAANCAGQANFFSQGRALQLVALEVVQVIQDWSNRVPLIQAKETWVRAHLQLTNAANPPVLIQGARLYGTSAGAPLPGSPLPPFNNGGTLLVRTANAAAGRGRLENSLNFRLPATWLAGAVDLQFVATNNLTVIPTNTVPANSTVRVTFIPSRPLPVAIFPVNWQRTADGNLQQNSANNLADLPRRILSMYPVPSVTSTLGQPLLAPFTAQPVQADYTALNQRLAGIRAFARFFIADNRIYHGAVARGGPAWPATGEAHLPGFVSSALMPSDGDFYADRFLRHLASHEIGHNLGRPHDINNATALTGPCGEVAGAGTPVYPFSQPVPPPAGPIRPALGSMTNGQNSLVYGLDTLTRANAPTLNPVADPNADFDVMGYCDHAPLQWWISASTYPAMLSYITNNFAPPAPPPPPGPVRRWLFMRGPVDFAADSGSFLPIYEMDTTSGYVPPTPVPGNYSLRLFDDVGTQLAEIPFSPTTDADETLGAFGAMALTGSFDIPVLADAYPAAIQRVELWEGGIRMLARKAAGLTTPQFTAAISVTQTSNSIHLAWSTLNANTYALQFSPDGGTTWDTLTVDWPTQGYDLDPQYLRATTNGIFRVIASDGFSSSSQVNGGPVRIAPHPPGLILNSPLDGSMFIGDQQIFLEASANDMQDGALRGTSLQWASSRDGFLGYGDVLNFEADNLSEGRHIITVLAINSAGLTSSMAVEIFVLRQAAPELAIVISGNQAALSWSGSVTNYLLESATDLVSGPWTPVTNAPVAADAEQTVNLNLSVGARFFRLRMP